MAAGVTIEVSPEVVTLPTALSMTAVPPVKVDVRLVLFPAVIMVFPVKDAVGSSTTIMVIFCVTVPDCGLLTVSVNVVVATGATLNETPEITVPIILSTVPVPPLKTGVISTLPFVVIVVVVAVKLVITGGGNDPPPQEASVIMDNTDSRRIRYVCTLIVRNCCTIVILKIV